MLYGAVSAGPVLWRRPALTGLRPMAPRLAWGSDPRMALTISWATDGPVRNPVVDFGVDDGFGRILQAETRTVPGWSVNYHRVTVDGLSPGGAYRYRIRHDGAVPTRPRTVRTAPNGGSPSAGPFTFAAYGDQGTTAGAERISRVLAVAAPAFTFCLGDLCYADMSGGVAPTSRIDHAAWDRWLRMVSDATAASAAVLPAVGNHEIETGMGAWGYDGFLARIALPGNGVPGLPTTWSTRWGNVALVALDANDASTEITRNNGVSGGAQDGWLEQTLAGLRADPEVDWIVVGFHHCAYCTNTLHGSDGGVRRWVPLFDRYEVDLVVNGHNHCYERTHPTAGRHPGRRRAARGHLGLGRRRDLSLRRGRRRDDVPDVDRADVDGDGGGRGPHPRAGGVVRRPVQRPLPAPGRRRPGRRRRWDHHPHGAGRERHRSRVRPGDPAPPAGPGVRRPTAGGLSHPHRAGGPFGHKGAECVAGAGRRAGAGPADSEARGMRGALREKILPGVSTNRASQPFSG